ncbi:MAG: DUF427 domain-containing protein [Pirellulales bacterium]
MKAVWNGTVIADSGDTIVVEGNHYFPPAGVRQDCLRESATTTVCGWKGIAHYYHVVVEGRTNPDAAWYYPEPQEAAQEIAGRIAFWNGVEVVGD